MLCSIHTMYEVLYNSFYGVFSFSRDFVEKVFRLYPPHTDVGKLLWENDAVATFVLPDEVAPEKNHYKIKDYIPFCEGYWIAVCDSFSYGEYRYTSKSYITDKHGQYYFLSECPYKRVWRTTPEVIAMAKAENIVNVGESDSEEPEHDLSIAHIPDDYTFTIKQCDGMETVTPVCPVETLLADMVRVIKTGSQGYLHPLTQRLLDGEDVRTVLYPNKA